MASRTVKSEFGNVPPPADAGGARRTETAVTNPGANSSSATMHTLDSVVRQHGTALLLDAASTRIQVGLWRKEGAPLWAQTGEDAAVFLFENAAQVLAAAGLRPGSVGAFVLCDGPGSQLGIRTACMAIRTWQQLRAPAAPVFGYRSLRLAAAAETAKRGGPFAVVTDARRDSWHVVRRGLDGSMGEVERISADELSRRPEPLLQPEGFRTWSKPPRPAETISYDCASLWRTLSGQPLLFELAEVSPWQSSTVAYQPWTGERHRGPLAQTAQQAAPQQ